ncbi:MAG: restriction endonuclease subunit S [Deltaproteobacteria bacterium]|nr:restriction endonuclease subunit S [Deltaproteobacteria bacterium]
MRFEQMAILVKDRIENPSEADVERYVGLKHLDPDSLKIRRWGEPADVEAAKLLFQPGDIIFGKRRAYQRKLAVADFRGICSAHAMVLRARSDVVLPEFLPFFMQSDGFMNRALEISEGSLSPTIKWRILAEQKFSLPSMNEQRRIVGLLRAVELSIESYASSAMMAETLRTSLCVSLRERNEKSSSSAISSLLVYSKTGLWGKAQDSADGTSVIVIRSTELDSHGVLDMAGGVTRSISTRNLSDLQLKRGDLLLEKSGGGPEQPVGRVGFVEEIPSCEHPFICGNFMQLLRPDPQKVDSNWLFWMMHGLHTSEWTLRHQTQTTGIRNLQVSDYLIELIPVPLLGVQQEQAREILSVEAARRDLLDRVDKLNQLKKSILNRNLKNEVPA